MSELDNLCEFVLQSNNLQDFHIRFNFLLNLAVSSFEEEIDKTNHLPFNSHNYIIELNHKINKISTRINETQLFFEQGQYEYEIMKDVFILILKEDFPEYFKNYLYQIKFRNN